jgi:hypothetical protein
LPDPSTPSMSTGELRCGICGAHGNLAWTEDGGHVQAVLPQEFHVEPRGSLGRVVVCNACDEIMPAPIRK